MTLVHSKDTVLQDAGGIEHKHLNYYSKGKQMKTLLITVLLLLITTIGNTSPTDATFTDSNQMKLTTTGVVYKCINEDVNPWGTCFLVQGNRWGINTPEYDPPTGTSITVTFTFQRDLNPKREHEDTFYVNNLIIHIPKGEQHD